MEEKTLKVVLNKSSDGHITPRVTIPLEWFKKMGLSEENREVYSTFNEKTGEFIVKKLNKK